MTRSSASRLSQPPSSSVLPPSSAQVLAPCQTPCLQRDIIDPSLSAFFVASLKIPVSRTGDRNEQRRVVRSARRTSLTISSPFFSNFYVSHSNEGALQIFRGQQSVMMITIQDDTSASRNNDFHATHVERFVFTRSERFHLPRCSDPYSGPPG